jgi:hypothetical protein
MRRASNARGLHMALNRWFQRADFKIPVNGPSAYSGNTFGKLEMQFGRFIVKGLTVMGQAISVAVDAVYVMGSDVPKPSRWRAVSRREPSVNLNAALCDLRRLAGFLTIILSGHCPTGKEKNEDSHDSKHVRHCTPRSEFEGVLSPTRNNELVICGLAVTRP